MNYCSRTKHESKILGDDGVSLKYPGVVFTTNKMNERRRFKRELDIADLRQKVNEGTSALRKAVEDGKDGDELPAGQLDKMYAEFNEMLHRDWYPAWIRWGLYSIEGLDIDDEKATVTTLCEAGPSDLVQEVFTTILAEAGISTAQEKNSASPGTSGAQEDGKVSDSTAPNADQPDGGKTAIAPSTIQAT